MAVKKYFNPFFPNAPFFYPLETSENRKVFGYFQGVEKGCIGNGWVKINRFIDPHRLTYYVYVNMLICLYLTIYLQCLAESKTRLNIWVKVFKNGPNKTLIWVGFLGVRFEVERGKVTPCLKLVRSMLEIINLVRKYAHIFSFRKYTF